MDTALRTDLPRIDEHHVVVAALAGTVWRVLTGRLANSGPGSDALARVLATDPRTASGFLLDEGDTVPGFRVAEAVPGKLLRLTGQHRFSRYSLVFRLATRPEGTVLSAESFAEFPGATGALYRRLVVTSRLHRLVVRRMLNAIRAEAEA